MKNFLYKRIIPLLAFIALFLIGITCRKILINREKEKTLLDKGINPIYTFWHGRELYFPYLYRFQNKHHTLVSPSRDGEISGNLLRLFGFHIVWGSTFKKGAMALLSIVRIVKNGGSVALAADGSRGPAFKAQDGTIKIAKVTGVPILPITYNASRKRVLSSWDKFIIPYPFSKIVVMYGEPINVPANADDETMELKRQELEKRLNEITEYVDKYFIGRR
ncbi:MAG: lysophospholipid acyltransferase family protein [Nitrospinae bacterium]|nr:lysophospholipid acyltransferase family protein [Nitrospinota bacterium]